ncbi:MAG: OsmC family peroxiredoxin [Pseudomonadota bacterium]
MPIRTASAVWDGNLKEGQGRMKLGSGAFEGAFSYATRFGDEPGTNPDELVGAVEAGCFSMYLSGLLSAAGFPPKQIRTQAKVHLDLEPRITLIELQTEADVPGLDDSTFQAKVDEASQNCPVSKALRGPEIRVTARLTT